MSFVNLHNHSFASLHDGYSSPKEMAETAKSNGQSAIALTDHGCLSAVPQFYDECLAAGVKPIIGNEMYICPDVTIKERSQIYHLIILAKDAVGYRNLLQLDTIAHQNRFYKPRIDMSILRQHKEGLIVTSACMGSWWNTDRYDEYTQQFKQEFGDDFYLEMQSNSLDDQVVYNARMMEMSEKYDIPLIITCDAHTPTLESCKYHRLWTTLNGDSFYKTDDFYIKSEQEVITQMSPTIPMEVLRTAIDNTQAIADKCNVAIGVSGNHFCKFPTDTEREDVRELCRTGWRTKINGVIPKEQWSVYVERFNHEMAVLEQCDYLNYLLIIEDIIKWCKGNDIYTGVGRGSCAGSLVCFLMDITKVDPIKYELSFERFVNIERRSPADKQ